MFVDNFLKAMSLDRKILLIFYPILSFNAEKLIYFINFIYKVKRNLSAANSNRLAVYTRYHSRNC